MADIWVTSDTHFGHKNIIKYCNRPFKDELEMNEVLIENWNKVVKPQDKVYHLGDVFFGKSGQVLHRLNGQKRLVLGNHDPDLSYLSQCFEKIMLFRFFKSHGLFLTHMPIHPNSFEMEHSAGRQGYVLNVHGHIHDQVVMTKVNNVDVPDLRFRCVSVEHTNYTPVHIDELTAR